MKMDLNLLIDELSSIENIQERRNIIFSDIHSPNPRFKAIADERSIQRAHDLGYWYVTGECLVECENGGVLVFEFQYSEGYLDGIIGTPYNKNDHGNHGIPF
jgi:hypothetical protein